MRALLVERILRIVLVAGSTLAAGCGTLPSGRGWGQDVAPLPGWDRVGWAAKRAALDPGTWAPAAGAVVLRAGGFDRRVSNWAVDHTPLFRSPDSADSMSTDLKSGLRMAAVATALATPSGENAGEWIPSKAKGLAVEWTASAATTLFTTGLKDAVGRGRPDGSGNGSFPSSNASESFAAATLTARNLECIAMPGGLRTGLQVGAYTVVGASSWARVEAGVHYPSDVLAGAALGHFLASFVHDAFLGLPDDRGPRIDVVPTEKGVMVVLGFDF